MQVLYVLVIKIKKTVPLYKLHLLFFLLVAAHVNLQNQLLSKERGPTC
jgi:hypothetical protein